MIVCALEDGQHSSAAAAYALWLSESLAVPLRLEGGSSDHESIAACHRSETELLVVGVGGAGAARLLSVLSLVDAARTPVVALPETASAAWENPHRARRTTQPNAVCGIDGSPTAARAAGMAAALATRLGGRLVIAHAIREPLARRAMTGSNDGVWNALRATDRARLLGQTLAELTECPSELCYREAYGEPVDVLDRVGAAESAALIAVGSRGVGRARLALSGSVAASLVRRATRPILIIPPAVDDRDDVRSETRDSATV